MASPTGYSRSQIVLHWGIALLILFQFLLSDAIGGAFRAAMRGQEAVFDPLVAQHVIGGFVILALVAWRLGLRLTRGAPQPPEKEHPALKLAAHVAHWAFYALMILLPVSGAVAWFGLSGPAAGAHEVLKAVLMALVGLHVAAALFHQFVLKTDIMARMKKAQA